MDTERNRHMRQAKFKILFLHGSGSSADVFEVQTASLRYQLEQQDPSIIYDFDFLDGAHPWPAAPGIGATFGDQQPYFSYHNGTAASILSALDDLAQYVLDHGPFDAIVGFSMGATLIAMLFMSHRAMQGGSVTDPPQWLAARTMVRTAVFLSCDLPAEVAALWNGTIERIGSRDVGARSRFRPIEIPTLHAWCSVDPEAPGAAEVVAQMCREAKRVEVLHSAGHSIPSSGSELKAITTAMHQMLCQLEALRQTGSF